MAPETAEGRADARADIYSLACCLYEMLTASPPFIVGSPQEYWSVVAMESPPPPSTINPDVPAKLDEIILRGLDRDPERRALTVADLGAVLSAGPSG